MKGAIASVEIFVFQGARSEAAAPRRLSLVIGAPQRSQAGDAWQCRVALADLHRPQILEGRDSIESLFRAVERARAWLADLEAEGFVLARDRAGAEPFAVPFPG